MNTTGRKAGFNQIEFNDAERKYKRARVTKLVRFSPTSHARLKRLARLRKSPMSRTLDHIISKYVQHQKHYELD